MGIKADGTVNYYTWGSLGDSVGDVGRIVSLYTKATHLCPDAAWTRRYLPVVETLGRHMLSLRSKAKSADLPTPTTGLVIGQPEHDWHRTQDKFFYNNNVWILRGMEELSTFLQQDAARNGTLGKLLETDATLYRTDIINSVSACLTKDAEGRAHFLPPYAELGLTPFSRMTGGRLAEYSNFRFYSETLLSDVLPKDIESMFLMWHNNMGGRIGGASRFSGWLDDMPTAGWGYGALTNNRTEDFLALLYGHAATYQSRGTFHSTEQLSFRGEGWYRDFLHWPNPSSAKTANLQYYGTENDVSFCIVSQVLVARLTRWQLVFEDFYRSTGITSPGSIWLARAAPKRWFVPGSQGFSVGNAPTRFGRVSFRMEVTQQGTTYFVTPPLGTPSDLRWKLRWPVPIESVLCQQCAVLEDADGIVTVVASHPASPFSVTANSSAVSWI